MVACQHGATAVAQHAKLSSTSRLLAQVLGRRMRGIWAVLQLNLLARSCRCWMHDPAEAGLLHMLHEHTAAECTVRTFIE